MTVKVWETVAVIISWFVFNISMGNLTKWIYLYGEVCIDDVCSTYRFPLSITVIHMVFSWVLCRVQIYHIRGAVAELGFDQQLKKIAPLSVSFAMSVAMGNLSLKYIYPSFNQMLGALAPVVTVVMAVLIKRKRYNTWTWVSMPVICIGLAVCSGDEVNFHALGALFCLGATVLRGLKSIIQEALLNSEEKSLDSVALLYYMAPWSGALLTVAAILTEGFQPITMLLHGFHLMPGDAKVSGGVNVFALLLLSGLNACFLNVANFLVTSYTSAVTLQVLGNVKSCLAIVISVSIFGNPLKMEQGLGVAACLIGVWVYQKKGQRDGGPAVKRVDSDVKSGGHAQVAVNEPVGKTAAEWSNGAPSMQDTDSEEGKGLREGNHSVP